MRRFPPGPGRLIAGLIAFVLFAAAVVGPVRPASAHGTLAMSVPAAGAVMTEPLTMVELYFTEKTAPNAHFTIVAPNGGRVDHGWSYGEPKPLDRPIREYHRVNGTLEPREYTTGFPAVVKVAHLPAVGDYSVSYLSVASDGEPVRGTLTFRYTGPVRAAPAGWSPPTDAPDPALLSAAQQHDSSGQGPAVETTSAAPPVSPASPPAGANSTADDDGGSGLLAWAGGAGALIALLAGLVVWRRRLVPAASPSGRPRFTTTTVRGRRADARNASSSSRRNHRPERGATAASDAQAESTSATAAPQVDAVPGTTRLALAVGAVVLALLAGFGLGRTGAEQGTAARAQAGPTAGGASATGPALSAGDGHQHAPGAGAHTHPGDGGAGRPAAGTAVSAAGHTMQPLRRSQPVGTTVDYRFRIVGADGQPVTRFVVVHDKPLHLVVVGRDLSGYQHLHPTMAADGTWSVPLRLARAGAYRVYADFTVTAGDGTPLPLVLGVDHHVPGAYAPVVLPAPRPQASAGAFTVAMTGTPRVGTSAPMAFGVGRDGTAGPVPVQRYLGAYGHLVVIREGDLGYVHVHPEPDLVNGAITFWVTVPSAGRYRAFLDFQAEGTVHTAEYTIEVR